MAGQLLQCYGGRALFALCNGGDPCIAALSHRHLQRNAAKVIEPLLFREALCAAASEDFGELTAVWAGKCRHVFNDAKDWHIHASEHRECLSHIGESNILWRCDEHCAGDWHRLRQRELCIRGSRWQVNNEIVEVAPLHVA